MRFYVLWNAMDIFNKDRVELYTFDDPAECVRVIHEWLEKKNNLECIPAAQEAAVRAANNGELPEMAFLCPEVNEPMDLEKYNGFYTIDAMSNCVFNLFLMVICDREKAERFKLDMSREYGIGADFSEAGDAIRASLNTFVESFDDPSIDPAEAVEAIRKFIGYGGFDVFSDCASYWPDVMDPSRGDNLLGPEYGSGFGAGNDFGMGGPGGMGGGFDMGGFGGMGGF